MGLPHLVPAADSLLTRSHARGRKSTIDFSGFTFAPRDRMAFSPNGVGGTGAPAAADGVNKVAQDIKAEEAQIVSAYLEMVKEDAKTASWLVPIAPRSATGSGTSRRFANASAWTKQVRAIRRDQVPAPPPIPVKRRARIRPSTVPARRSARSP